MNAWRFAAGREYVNYRVITFPQILKKGSSSEGSVLEARAMGVRICQGSRPEARATLVVVVTLLNHYY